MNWNELFTEVLCFTHPFLFPLHSDDDVNVMVILNIILLLRLVVAHFTIKHRYIFILQTNGRVSSHQCAFWVGDGMTS